MQPVHKLSNFVGNSDYISAERYVPHAGSGQMDSFNVAPDSKIKQTD
jgi:hypothetical protein